MLDTVYVWRSPHLAEVPSNDGFMGSDEWKSIPLEGLSRVRLVEFLSSAFLSSLCMSNQHVKFRGHIYT